MNDGLASYNAVVAFLRTELNGEKPFVLETARDISLHFDHFAVQSSMSRQTPDRLTLSYTRSMMGFVLLQPRPRHITMVGLGGGSLAKYCYRNLPQAMITAVEISPDVIALREVFRIPPDDWRFNVICADGAEYIREPGAHTDVILVDAFVGPGLASQCATIDFFAACWQRLSDAGVLVINFSGDDRDLPAHVWKLSTVFGTSYSLVANTGGANYIGFAWKGASRLPSRQALLALVRSMNQDADLRLGSVARKMKDGERLALRRLVWPGSGPGFWRIDA